MFSGKPIKSFTYSLRLVNYATKVPKPEIPKNPLASVYSATSQKDNGVVYDKKPFKLTLEAGKTYHWCLCGRSKSQPLCDGTHKDIYLKVTQSAGKLSVSSLHPRQPALDANSTPGQPTIQYYACKVYCGKD